MGLVDVELRGAVRHVRLNRPEKRNALNPPMIQALHDAFAQEPHAGERVVLLDAGADVDAKIEVYGGLHSTLELLLSSAHPRAAGLLDDMAQMLSREA